MKHMFPRNLITHFKSCDTLMLLKMTSHSRSLVLSVLPSFKDHGAGISHISGLTIVLLDPVVGEGLDSSLALRVLQKECYTKDIVPSFVSSSKYKYSQATLTLLAQDNLSLVPIELVHKDSRSNKSFALMAQGADIPAWDAAELQVQLYSTSTTRNVNDLPISLILHIYR